MRTVAVSTPGGGGDGGAGAVLELAGAVGARQLVLVKPAGAAGADLIDPYFSRVLPADVAATVLSADELSSALRV